MEKYEPTGFALDIFKDRYAISPEETFQEACQRVASFIASAEEGEKIKHFEQRFFDIMSTIRFCPAGRIFRGAGRPKPQMLNCFILEFNSLDSREGWGEIVKDIIIISGTGGGAGVNFSKVRPRGAPIGGLGGEATGSVSLQMIINAAAEEIRGGSSRRAALMHCLDWHHPDLPEFLEVKLDQKKLNNANISVCIDNEFLDLVENNGEIVFSWLDKEYSRMKAKDIFDKIIENASKCAEPGILNRGFANEQNNLYYLSDGELVSTNPCGEVWGKENDCCDLGSINLHAHVQSGKINWDMLDETTRLAVRFLDNVLDQNYFPLKKIEETCKNIRRLGVGVFGVHDMLLELGIKYSSQEAINILDKVMSFIKKKAYDTSIMLATEKGSFPLLDKEKIVKSGFAKKSLPPAIKRKILEYGLRNCAILDIAPTGTISIMCGVSSGVEPIFAPIYRRRFNKHKNIHKNKREQSEEIVIHPLLVKFSEEGRDYSHFEGSHEIYPEQHILIQKVCQKHIDNSLSKTINLPKDFLCDNLGNLILKHIRELKGLTIYKEGSRKNSPLEPLPIKDLKKHIKNSITKCEDNTCITGVCDN